VLNAQISANVCLRFLQEQAVHAEALYVLGDLFEAWIGDDDLREFNLSIADGFKTLADSGVKIILFMVIVIF